MKDEDLVLEAVKAFLVWPDGATHILEFCGRLEAARKEGGEMKSLDGKGWFIQDDWRIACTREQHIRKRIELYKPVKVSQMHLVFSGVVIPRPTPEEMTYIAEIDSEIRSEKLNREQRYVVFKIKDINKALTDSEKQQLSDISEKIEIYRDAVDKQPLNSVVVESDWPEYEAVWKMIEGRCKSESEIDGKKEWVPEVGQECEFSTGGESDYKSALLLAFTQKQVEL